MKQPQYSPLSIWEQTSLLFAANEGALDDIPVEKISEASKALLAELKRGHKKEMDVLNTGDKPDDKIIELIVKTAKIIAKDYK